MAVSEGWNPVREQGIVPLHQEWPIELVEADSRSGRHGGALYSQVLLPVVPYLPKADLSVLGQRLWSQDR